MTSKKSLYIPAKEIMKKNGVSMSVVKRRLNNGWDFEGAISTPPNSRTKYDKPIRLIAIEHGMKPDTLRQRIYRYKMTLEEAVSIPVNRYNRFKEPKDEPREMSVKEMAELTGLSKRAVYLRLEKGWTVEEILNTPKYSKRKGHERGKRDHEGDDRDRDVSVRRID